MKLILISILFTLTLSVLDPMWRYPRNYKSCYDNKIEEQDFFVDKNGKAFVIFKEEVLKEYLRERVETRYDYLDNMTFKSGKTAWVDADQMARCRHERKMEHVYNTCVNYEIEKVCNDDRYYLCFNKIYYQEKNKMFRNCDDLKRDSSKETLDYRVNKLGIYYKVMSCIENGTVRKKCIAKYMKLYSHPFKIYYNIISILAKIINPDCTEKYYWDCLEDKYKSEVYWIYNNLEIILIDFN